MANNSVAIAVLEGCMTEKQRRFMDSYRLNDGSPKKIALQLGITERMVQKYKNMKLIRGWIELSSDPETREMDEVNLDWIRGEMKRMYDGAKDEVEKAKWFDKIMKFQDKWGAMVTDEDLKIRSMESRELIVFTQRAISDLNTFIEKNSWQKTLSGEPIG